MPESTASVTNSPTCTHVSCRAETPQARMVRSIGSRCSSASPIAECTMNSPTTNDSRPNVVRLRWKLAVRRSRSLGAPASTRRSRSPATSASAGRARLSSAGSNSRDT